MSERARFGRISSRVRPMNTPTLQISALISDEAVWLRVEGDLDRLTVLDLDRALFTAERSGAGTVGLEASRVGFVDASGLHALASAARRARRRGSRFVVARPSARLRRLLELTMLSSTIELVDSAE